MTPRSRKYNTCSDDAPDLGIPPCTQFPHPGMMISTQQYEWWTLDNAEMYAIQYGKDYAIFIKNNNDPEWIHDRLIVHKAYYAR